MLSLYCTLITLSVLSICFSLGFTSENQSLYISLIPLSFFLCSILFHRVYFVLYKSFVFKAFIAQASIRYLLLPALFASGGILKFGQNSQYIEISMVVMAIEVFFIFFIFQFFSKKHSSIFNQTAHEVTYFGGKFIIPSILSVMFLYIYISGALVNINPIWNLGGFVDQYITQGEELQYNVLGLLIFNTFKVVLVLYVISLIAKSKISKNLKKWLFLIPILGSSLFIVGVSRFSIILNVAVMFSLLSFIMDKKSVRKIIYVSFPIISLIFLFVTIAKFSRYGANVEADSLLTASSLNAYFSGFGNIAMGFEAYEYLNWNEGFLFLFNDIFQNVPLLSNFTTNEYKTVVRFNESMYGHRVWADQIVPASVSGLFHFGYIGLFLYTPFFIALALYMEKMAYKVKFIGYKYIFSFLAINFSLIFMLNVGGFYGTIVRTFIFLFIPILIIKLLTNLKFKMRYL